MRTSRTLGVAILGFLLAGSAALAAEGDQVEGGGRRPPRMQPPVRQKDAGLGLAALKELNLSADQRSQIDGLLATHKQAMANLQGDQGELASLKERYRKAVESGDKEAVKQIQAEMKQAAQQRQGLVEQLHKDILDVLNDEQKAKFLKLTAPRKPVLNAELIRRALRRMELTDKQKADVEAILKTAQIDAEGKDKAARQAVWQKAIADIKALLAPEQGQRLEKLLAGPAPAGAPGGLKALGLTEKQAADINAIRDEYREKITNAAPEDRPALMQQMREAMKAVLTPEQLEKMANRPERTPDRPRPRIRERARPDAGSGGGSGQE